MSLELLEKPETKRKEIELELSTKLLSVALSDARYKVFWGGRGGGKSYFIADFLLSKAVEPNKKYRTLCAREIMATIKDSVHRLLCDRINDLGLDRYFRITRDSITSIYGSEFFFKGLKSNVSEIKSMQRINYVWCEEAERISEESWNVLIPTIREEGSEIWISFNPEDEKASTYQRFIINPSPNCESIHLTYKDNKYFPEVLRKEMEYDKRVDYEKYEHVWLGMVKKYGEAVIFKDKVLIEEFPEPEYGTQFFFGADWGYAVDPTCLIRMFMKENTLYIDHEFYAVGVEINELPQAFESVPQSKKWKIVADNARPETISYLYNRGFNIEGSKKGKGSVEDGIQFLRSFEKIIIHPRCKGTIGDFKNYKWKQDKMTGEILPIPVDSSNHAPDACLKRDTLVLTSKGEKKICDIKKGEEVLTRAGFKKVLWSGVVGKHAKVVKVETQDGKSLVCTPEHRILKSSCFTRADVLSHGDELLTLNQKGEQNQDYVLTVYDIKERVEVWDLTIQDQPEFFANRILVHNSRYALEAYIKKSNQAGVFVPDWKMPNLQGR